MRILLADAYPAARLGSRVLLQEMDDTMVVGECEKTEDAIPCTEKLDPDLVVLDLGLEGGLSPLEVCRGLKSLPYPPRVLIYTGGNSREEVAAASLAGADGYLYKGPGCGQKLPEVARRVCEGQRDWLLGPSRGESSADLKAIIDGADLTRREQEVLTLVMERFTNPEIAGKLHLSQNTVKTHVARSLRKLGFKNRRELLNG